MTKLKISADWMGQRQEDGHIIVFDGYKHFGTIIEEGYKEYKHTSEIIYRKEFADTYWLVEVEDPMSWLAENISERFYLSKEGDKFLVHINNDGD